MDNDNSLKNKSLFTDYHALAGHLSRKYKNPTEEQGKLFLNALRNAMHFGTFWIQDREIIGWEKRQDKIDASLYLKEEVYKDKIEEQKEFLEETQGVPTDEDVVVGGN